MTRHHWLNVSLGALALALVAVASYLEAVDGDADGSLAQAMNTAATVEASSTSRAETTIATTTSTSTTTTTTVPASTVAPTTLPPATEPPLDRALLSVVVAKGPGGSGQVGVTRDILRMIGYGEVRGVNGAVRQSASVVYFATGLQASAEQLALDASLTAADIAPMAQAPPVAGLADAALLLYLG